MMTGNANLVVTLVDRLATRLPHRTGSPSNTFIRDEVVTLTRATLINVSSSCIGIIVGTLVQLLEELSRSDKGIQTHPVHIIHSELYILELLADCLVKHWTSINTYDAEKHLSDVPNLGTYESSRRTPGNQSSSRDICPDPLEDDLVRRLLNSVKVFLDPVSENYVPRPSQILDDTFASLSDTDNFSVQDLSQDKRPSDHSESAKLLRESSTAIEAHARDIVEYVSYSNWTRVFEYFKLALRGANPLAVSTAQITVPIDDDRSALATLRLISSFWVDSRKLGIIIQELCGSFLHLRKAFQTTIAIVLPLMITRWLERNPEAFVELHTSRKRLDGGAETLFDMSNTMIDSARRKTLLFPFQTSLLFLLPDVFEVASNMRDVKSSSISKKVSFLEMLRKSLRSRNESAVHCLTSILRVARHFPLDSDAAILSYALDVHEEVREAVFRRYAPVSDTPNLGIDLMTAVFVSLAHLNLEICIENLVPFCLLDNSPQDFKIAVMSACAHFARQPNAEDYLPLFSEVAEFVRTELKGQGPQARDSLTHDTNSSKFSDKKNPSEIIYSILIFLDASPLAIFIGAPDEGLGWSHIIRHAFASFVEYLFSDDERIGQLTSVVARRIMTEGLTALWRKTHSAESSQTLKSNFWRGTSAILIQVSDKVIQASKDATTALTFIHDYLESRMKLLRNIEDLIELTEDFPERAAASTKLETAFLVSLCSSDISTCQLVTKCLRLYCDEARLMEETIEVVKLLPSTLRNIGIYADISAKDFRFTGLVAFQKRVRGLLRQIQYPTQGILTAWESVFELWFKSSKHISSRGSDAVEETSLVEWRNYSGFLASLGGSCISSHTLVLEEPDMAGKRWIDVQPPEGFDDSLLDKYLKQSVQLLASNNVRVREITRETLSVELSPSLYLPLFESLERELSTLFDHPWTKASPSGESRVIFAEQAAALLKSILEKLGGPNDNSATLSIDIGALALSFARFLSDVTEVSNVLRVKIKICQLCETFTQKKELLNLRQDVRIRNQLLEVIFSWIARPGSPKVETVLSTTRVEDVVRLQRDLDRACLKALADLTYRLPLQPSEGQTDADTSDRKSEMFRTYFNRFLSLLNHEPTELSRNEVRLNSGGHEDTLTTSELAINALSNLLSANIDVGLKHSLGIGYHEDLNIRTAFVKVLCNILIQGMDFNYLSDAAVNERYQDLLELLLRDMTLTIALCDACPSTEVDEMTISLLNIFDSRGLGFSLLEALIEHEVDETENEAELLRRNCVATKMLSVYARWKGTAYLKATLQNVLERLMSTSQDLDLELDPARTTSTEELQKNALQLKVVTKAFIEDICNSASHIPVSFRKICNIISTAVMRRFEDAKFTAVGAFIFLRFFCPAIVAPEAEGLTTSAPSKEMRRGLLLIAKVVQNLANNVLFGAKEPYMFPLNDFLTQNIYRVTTFLREISVAPHVNEPVVETESFDFGSCVALHRFLYDHWDLVRQKLVAQERKDSSRTPLEISKSQNPTLESLRKLFSKLGPPPMDVSWNRPAIAWNTPPSYSRFQHFMLRNAGRNTESFASTRAIYDGGESKDGLPMICVILRNIDIETVDYELLLFGYLKIASRMWHRPFGILIDATCYNGQNEPQDALFRKLDILTPSELAKQLSRIYVYNMNSAFRKCFRRILRLSAKGENGLFHPKNVEYHLIGSLQDLQSHFHLSQLHLPKETISVVTDTRYVFQPITRLSKTKGKIDVVIKIGSQFVQVTTTKKQEIMPGLRAHATVNDIFRLSDVDEATPSIQTEDDSAFGLRTENGKIVMYFTSPRKQDVLQEIRGAKAKYSKELRQLSSFERLVRPQDVPGTLLNIALTNMASPDQILRLAAYNLLCALCRAFNFAGNSKFMTAKELCVPLNPSAFIIDISQQIAKAEPQLTADFLNEFFVGWESFPYSQRPLSLAYMAPWLPSLRFSLIPNDPDSDKTREKVTAIFRKLIEVAMSDSTLSTTLEQLIWPIISQDEIYVDIFLEEIVKAALAFGLDDERTEMLGSIVASLGTVSIRGKLLSRLRKALNRTSLRPTRLLPENIVWTEICVLLRLCLSTSFDSGVQSQLFLPEVFHLVTMLANTGPPGTKLLVHRLLVNTIHAIYTSFPLDDVKLANLKGLVISLSDSGSESFFNISLRDGNSSSASQDVTAQTLVATENIAMLLSEVSQVAAPSVNMSNAWRSRWMSLVASTAFQSNPAIQPRAFTVMGCLAREDVDDDLLYQVLVALRSSISRFTDDDDSEMLVAIVTSLTKMMEKLPSASRYGLQLFWLAVSLVRLVPPALFNCAALFLNAVLSNIATSGEFEGGRMVPTLLQGRIPIEDAALHLDEIYGIHFTMENFHFAICATLVKGLTNSVTRATTTRVLYTFLQTTSSNLPGGAKFPQDASVLPYLGLLMFRATTDEESKEIFWLAGVRQDITNSSFDEILGIMDFTSIKDKELLLNAAIGILDFKHLEEVIQNNNLIWLDRIATRRPTVILHLCGPVMTILDEILMSCQNTTTLETAHRLLRTLTSNPKFSGGLDTSDMLEDVLDGIGFGGLWRSSTFHTTNEQDQQCITLTDKLIELIIA